MSRLDELIARLCPDGVPIRALGDVIKLNFGSRITKLNDSGSRYPVYGGGGESFRTDAFNREDEYVISRFAMSERCVRKIEGKFWMLDSGFTFEPTTDDVNKDFIAYLLFNMQPKIYACSSQGAQKNLKTTEFKKFEIPVPPLSVQGEIVRVLDAFTNTELELEATLQKELNLRRTQFAVYRERLFEFGNDAAVGWTKLSDAGEFTRGRRFTKNDMVADGISSIHYGDIYKYFGTFATKAVSHVRRDLRPSLRFASPGDLVIASVGETVEDVGKAVAWLGDDEVAIHDDCFSYRHSMDPKYVAYYFQTARFHTQKDKYVARAKVKRLSAESIGKLTIPVPDREEQSRVVAILDQLESLVSELVSRLPSELAARRIQYEYYRSRLLTFEVTSA